MWFVLFVFVQIYFQVSTDCKQAALRPLETELERTQVGEAGQFERRVLEYAGFKDVAGPQLPSMIPLTSMSLLVYLT